MSERKAKQHRRHRAQVIEALMSATPDHEPEKAQAVRTKLMRLSHAQFAVYCGRLAEQIEQMNRASPMRPLIPADGAGPNRP